MPKVSVVIPTYNCAKFLPEAIDSVLAQTYHDYEMVIVDDGSTDNTKEVLGKYFNQYPDKIRYIYQQNQGLAIARNTGIKNARGEWLALLDADDVWCSTRLEEELTVAESDSEIGLVHANITRISEEGMPIITPKRKKQFLSERIFEHLFLRQADISCPTVLFKKSCCDKVGLFDEQLARLGCEDRDLWLRIAREYKVVYVDSVLAFYRVRKTSMSRNQEKMVKARYYVVDKFYPLKNGNCRLRKQALARIHRDLGDELLFEQDFEKARLEYIKSIQIVPYWMRTWINLMKALLQLKVKNVY